MWVKIGARVQRRSQRSGGSVLGLLVVLIGSHRWTRRSIVGGLKMRVDIDVVQFAIQGPDGLLEFDLERLLQGQVSFRINAESR